MKIAARTVRLLVATGATLWALNAAADPAELRKLAHDYYQWRDAAYPTATSTQGDHRYDDRLTDFSPAALNARRTHVSELLQTVKGMSTAGWSRDDRGDPNHVPAPRRGGGGSGGGPPTPPRNKTTRKQGW